MTKTSKPNSRTSKSTDLLSLSNEQKKARAEQKAKLIAVEAVEPTSHQPEFEDFSDLEDFSVVEEEPVLKTKVLGMKEGWHRDALSKTSTSEKNLGRNFWSLEGEFLSFDDESKMEVWQRAAILQKINAYDVWVKSTASEKKSCPFRSFYATFKKTQQDDLNRERAIVAKKMIANAKKQTK